MEIEKIEIIKEEKRGIYIILILYFISWGAIILPLPHIGLISWLSLGLIGFSLWRIIEGLFSRIKENKPEKEENK